MNPAIQKKMEMILKMRGNRKMTLMIFINNNPFSFLFKKKKKKITFFIFDVLTL